MEIRGLVVLLGVLTASGASARLQPRIVNGATTFAYPAVAMIAFYADPARTELVGLCSGTLVGCHTVITAAHCVCPENADDYATCQSGGVSDPSTLVVFLPHVGVLPVGEVTVHPSYVFGEGYDVSVLRLVEPADGVRPLSLATTKPEPETTGTVVGYGTTRAGVRSVDDTGIERAGSVTFGACPSDVPADLHVCWEFTGTGANTCSGDSGGAVVAKEGGTEVLTGIVSGGSTFDCLAPDQSFATAVASVRDWIQATAKGDVGVACGSSGLVDDGSAAVRTFSVSLDSATPQVQERIEVTPEASELRVTFNGQTGSDSGFLRSDNDFDLLVGRVDTNNAITWVCRDERPENWGACRIERPQAGSWVIELRRISGSGPAQITATIFVSASGCAGDCNGDSTVEVSEIVTAVNIALGSAAVSACPVADRNADGTVTVDEIVQAVSAALNGCSGVSG